MLYLKNPKTDHVTYRMMRHSAIIVAKNVTTMDTVEVIIAITFFSRQMEYNMVVP